MKVGERVRRNFLMQVKSKQPVMGTLAITLMLLATAIIFIGIVPEKAEAVYTDYTYYKTITINHDYIDSTLTNFPILVHDNTGDLQSQVLANGSDIAFYAVDNSTQYNHEIEWYNSTSGELWAWVNVTSIASGTDTLFYMYYNDSDGSYPVGHNPVQVWDSNFLAVWHMNNASNGQTDSTHQHNATEGAAPEYQATGKCGYGIEFETDNSDYLIVSNDNDLDGLSAITIEYWINEETTANTRGVIFCAESLAFTGYAWLFFANAGTLALDVQNAAGNAVEDAKFTGVTVGVWYHVTANWTTTNKVGIQANGTFFDTSDLSLTGMYADDAFWVYIGKMVLNNYLDAVLDELRISDIERNASWVKANYHTQNQTTGFLTLGDQIGDESTYTIKGLPNDIITWSGTAGTSVWCNSSGDTNEWLEVNMSINVTDNVTEIRVWVGDLNDTAACINSSNITLYATNAANTTYYSFGTFSDGGSNITINKTTWNTYANVIANPFNDLGLTNKTTSIFLIFKLIIPAGLPTDIFWSVSSTAWKIYIGYDT